MNLVSRAEILALDQTAAAVSTALTSKGHRHAFLGGYAVCLIGGARSTLDVDVLVGAPAVSIRAVILEEDERFVLKSNRKLIYLHIEVAIEILQGGANNPLKLPDANSVQILRIAPSHLEQGRSDTEIPIIHPTVLLLTKIKRWMFIAESTRPNSQVKARNDFHDIQVIFERLAANNARVDFGLYPEKPKDQLLPGFQLLYKNYPAVRDRLKETINPEDFGMIS